MKKYILLATTAVLMTTANAWADPVTVSVPALGIQAELTPLAAFTRTANLNFGGMVFDKTDLGSEDYVSFGSISSNSDTPDYDASVKAVYGTTSRGKYTYTGSLNLNGGTFTVGGKSCVLGNGHCFTSINDGAITLGGNAQLAYVDVQCTEEPKECYFGGDLQVKKEYLESLTSIGTLSENLTITYNY